MTEQLTLQNGSINSIYEYELTKSAGYRRHSLPVQPQSQCRLPTVSQSESSAVDPFNETEYATSIQIPSSFPPILATILAIPAPVVQDDSLSDSLISFAAFCITQVAQSNIATIQQRTGRPHQSQSTAEQINSLLEYLLRRLKKHAQLRTTELLQALCYIDTMSKQHWAAGEFILCPENVFLSVLVCVMLAHKFNTDKPFSNAWFSKCFGVSLTVLNKTEESVLELLGYELKVKEDVYGRYHQALVEGSKKRENGGTSQPARNSPTQSSPFPIPAPLPSSSASSSSAAAARSSATIGAAEGDGPSAPLHSGPSASPIPPLKEALAASEDLPGPAAPMGRPVPMGADRGRDRDLAGAMDVESEEGSRDLSHHHCPSPSEKEAETPASATATDHLHEHIGAPLPTTTTTTTTTSSSASASSCCERGRVYHFGTQNTREGGMDIETPGADSLSGTAHEGAFWVPLRLLTADPNRKGFSAAEVA